MAEKYIHTMRVEIPKGSNIKYEIKDDKIICDRILHTPVNYVFNYGYFEGTLAGDGDPLDVCLIMDEVLVPGCYIECKIIGVLVTEDEAGQDEKILAVPSDAIDPKYTDISDLKDLSDATQNKIKFFFENYKILEKNKKVIVKDFEDKVSALNILSLAKQAFQKSSRNN